MLIQEKKKNNNDETLKKNNLNIESGFFVEPDQENGFYEPINKKNSFNKKDINFSRWDKRIPCTTLIITFIQISVFIFELVKVNKDVSFFRESKSIVNLFTNFPNYFLVSMGARFIPCMKEIKNLTTSLNVMFTRPRIKTNMNFEYNLNNFCGMTGIPTVGNKYVPNQWYRFITAIFIHGRFTHVFINLLVQLFIGYKTELFINPLIYLLVYFSSGIAGFLLGANLSTYAVVSVGASGSIFGLISLNLILIIYYGKKFSFIFGIRDYYFNLFLICFEILITFFLGLFPGIDNYSHIGGFIIGLMFSILLLPDPSIVYKKNIIFDYNENFLKNNCMINDIFKNFNKKRMKVFLFTIFLRVLSLFFIIFFFIFFFLKFYNSNSISSFKDCAWCKYINCLPISDWCDY